MNELRIDVADLLAHPGARRVLRATVPVEGLGTATAAVREPVELDLALERVPEGLVVRGTLGAGYEAACSNCLRPVHGRLEVAVSELFEDVPVDGETYRLEGHVIDLDQLLRDALLLELPLAPACPAGDLECVAASAPVVDDAEDDPSAATDPRWAALSQLEL
jgi:uncharacterized protein